MRARRNLAMTDIRTIFISIWILLSVSEISGAPCYVQRTYVSYYYRRVCTCRIWGWCTHYANVRYRRVSTQRHCCPGYRSDCTTPICISNCNSHGSCVAPNVCSCSSQYTGSRCEIPVCNPSCIYGHCTAPNTCTCYSGFQGQRCDQPICRPGCQNGGSCVSPNTCRCGNGYMGVTCNQAICNPYCLNGGTCARPNDCECTAQYTGDTCQTPVCVPACANGGTCVEPNVCSCRETYAGDRCQKLLCSHNYPCFPGTCAESSNDCTCEPGFAGTSENNLCRTMNIHAAPVIATCSATLANIERTGDKRELYRFMTDASAPNSSETEMLWLNQKDYNYINISFEAFYEDPVKGDIPHYIKDFKFGIVGGQIIMKLSKVARSSQGNFISINSSVTDCKEKPGSLNPNQHIFDCELTYPDFDRILEHADNLTLTVKAENGGFRKLVKPSIFTSSDTDIYKGQNTSKDMMFRFDFHKPHHCALNGSCSTNPFTVNEDITKNAIQFHWNGWLDDLSGIRHFKIDGYQLKPNDQIIPYLIEPNAELPFKSFILSSGKQSFEYTPEEAGMYSFVLNVVDLANNTQCSRTLVLYDPTSAVSTNPNTRVRVSSAAQETGYEWQSNTNNEIHVQWMDHFHNQFHVDNKLLIRVKKFRHINWLELISKYVPDELDDKDGKRTLTAISNINGIVKFEYQYSKNNGPYNPWNNISNISEESVVFNVARKDGDTIRISIRAEDAMKNQKVDKTTVHFDSTPPNITEVEFIKNIHNTTYPFSSRLEVVAFDKHSGIFKIDWKMSANDSGAVFKNGSITGNRTLITPESMLGRCIPMGDCFYYKHTLDVNNCWLVVPQERLLTEFVRLEVTVFNQAYLQVAYNMTITNLTSLDGINKYSGPMNLRVADILDNGVRLAWTLSPSCYKRSKITLIYRAANGAFKTITVDKDATSVDLTGLNPETNYTLEFLTSYGRQTSSPVKISFKTEPEKPAIATPVLAAILAVIIILLAIIVVGIILWRTGRLSIAKEGLQRRMTTYASRINKRLSRSPFARTNNAYTADEDDIYLYGQMEYNNKDNWVISHSDIVLETLLTSGRFADIYKARHHKNDNSSEIVVAKVLRDGFSDEMELAMKAKINFYEKKVGHDPNILKFIGAVIDNSSLGPYMILEYCEKGQLRNWLLLQKNNTTEETLERLYRISYDISKGMSHLEIKQIVHGRLAARNVLLTGTLEPKIAGFGPETNKNESTDEDGGTATAERERIPIKWTAPECLTTMKSATTKSDVWSYAIVLWEIFSFGETPYPDIRSRDVQGRLKAGYRLPKPEFATDLFYKVMTDAWHLKPKQRPTFRDITADIGKMFNVAESDEFYYYSQK